MRYKCSKCEYVFVDLMDSGYCPCCDSEFVKEIPFNDDKYIGKEEMHDHHIHPKFMGNPKGLGQQYTITKTNHDILHGKIMNWIWEEVEDKEKAIKNIISKSKEEIGVDDV